MLSIVTVLAAACLHRKGLDLEQLKTQAREEARNKERKEAATLVASFKKEFTPATTRTDAPQGGGLSNTRRDSSPVKVCLVDV